MAIPDFQSIMRPMLDLANQRGPLHLREFMELLSIYFELTEAERTELLPSGSQARFDNRVNWAASYLKRAGFLTRPARATYEITEGGKRALNDAPDRIVLAWLEPHIDATKGDDANDITSKATQDGNQEPEAVDERTPEEQIEANYLAIRDSLAAELLTTIKERSPTFFEHLVIDLLVAMGYGGSLVDAGRAIGKTGDGGIDGIIKEDRLGLGFIYIQAKRWEGAVQRPAVQAFAGSLQGHHASKGVFITTSTFSDGARTFAERLNTRIVLIDGHELAQLMIDYNVGVAMVTTYAIKRVDAEYFEQ